MIPVLINGFAPSTDRETKVSLWDRLQKPDQPPSIKIGEAIADENGLAAFSVNGFFIDAEVYLFAAAPSQKPLSRKVKVAADGAFRTLPLKLILLLKAKSHFDFQLIGMKYRTSEWMNFEVTFAILIRHYV